MLNLRGAPLATAHLIGRNPMNIIQAAAASLLLTGSALAGDAAEGIAVIDATEYLPLGTFNAWEMIDADNQVDGDTQIISVKKTTVVDGIPRYNVRTKIFDEVADVIFQFGVDGSEIYLYAAKVAAGADLGDDDLSVSTMFFTPPVFVGDTSQPLDGPPAVTPITSSIKVKLKIGPKSIKAKVDVAGTISTSWQSVGPVLTPNGTIPGNNLAQLRMDFFFTYSSDDDDIDDVLQGETTNKTVRGIMGVDAGYVQIDGAGSKVKVLNRAILPNNTVGNFPPLTVDLAGLVISTPFLFNLFYGGGAEGVDPSDGFVTLSNVDIQQRLGGKTFMTADVSVAGVEGGTIVPVQFTGKTKFKPDGTANVSMKAKTAHPDLTAKLNMKIKAALTDTSTSMTMTYKAGKDIDGLPIVGEVDIPISPEPVANAVLNINRLLDVKFDPNPLKRKLGAEGTLTLGSLQIPVTVLEKVKVKEGFPEKRNYALVQTGTTKPKLFKWAASNTDNTDYLIAKLKGKLLGLKIKPEDPSLLPVSLDDE